MTSSTLSPVTLPSLVAESVSFCHWSRPWWAVIRLSLRVSVNFTGLPRRRATAKTIHSSGVVWSLPPKPPPTSGAITRIFDSGTPVVAASAKRRMCGIWVADHMVICSPVGSTTVLRGSMNAGMSRCWRYSRSITMPSPRAFSIASSTLPPVPASAESNLQNADLFVPSSGWARTPFSLSAAAAAFRSSAAGSSSYSTSTSSAASRASAGVRATTTATTSPANATRSMATGRCVGVTWSVVIAQALMSTPCVSARSWPVRTATTLGEALAAATSTEVMFAWANGLRTIARCSIPGRVMLSVHRVRPVIRRWSSLRRRSLPISRSVAGRSCVAVMPTPPPRSSPRRAARTSRCCGSRCSGTGCPRDRAAPPPRSGSGSRSAGRRSA